MKTVLKFQLLIDIIERARPNPAGELVFVLFPRAGAVVVKRLHRGEDRGQPADDRQVWRLAIRRWRNEHLLDKFADEVEMPLHFIMFGIAGPRHGRKCCDRHLIHRRIDDEDFGRTRALDRGPPQLGFKFVSLFLQIFQQPIESGDLKLTGHQTLGHLVGNKLLFPRDVEKGSRESFFVALTRLARCGQLFVDLVLDGCGALNGQQVGRNGIKNPRFQFGATDGFGVRTNTDTQMCDWQLLLPVRASITILGHDGVRPAAYAALKQAAEQILRPVGAVKPVGRCMGEACLDFELPLLDLGPQFIIDDPELRHLSDHPFAFVVHPSFALLGLRILPKLPAVEHQSANICLVVEDAGSPVTMTADRSVAPHQTPWARHRWNTVIEFDGKVRWRSSNCILAENPADYLSLFFVDFAQAGDAVEFVVVLQLHPVAIGNAASSFALADGGLHAFTRFVARLFDHIVIDDGAQAKLHVIDRRLVLYRPKLDAVMAELLQDA
nr:hypothetical protein [Rhizobium sp. CG5]